ncbi:MAG: TIGR02186 family protein, partial [Lentibacter algarum]|uniref:TIGR02186 family protein n=2 Tax=Roseobacteraceae TaxID=2854170 RepID=UPI003C785B9E
MRFALALVCLVMATVASAENVVLGLSQRSVSITTNFDGSEILIFGAVKREAALPEGDPIQVVIAVSGPNQPLTVRRKDKR